ncbi:alcohol dehydrogenase [Phenylobacterium sp.]|uniref:alcohol dehydrogenase n=1 Tax=Phenylobacterium sp. TaxID=1871053 RepID=UPI002E2EEBC2|nr:alcohol dehydrogenase [Phenylobacterium sp.]HEX4712768.1 alcohol dehydrogenase [Phenylobacterium sp.]
MPTMRVVQIANKGGPFELVERELPQPGAGEVRVKVHACGVCHSDSIAKDGLFPSVPYPIVPGHEIAGVVDAVGEGVIGWSVGTRVGVGWFGGHCGRCEPCRRGDLVDCRNLRIPGVTYDGGYAEAMVAPADALALIPDELSAVDAAPLLCAGVTTYNALRESGARPGDLVAILGIGGLGHLGVQFAAKMGFRTVAIARGAEKESLARRLGAHVYLNSQTQDVGAELTRLGGAKTILATITSGKAMSAAIPGLAVRGNLVVVGVGADPIEVLPLDLILASRSVVGHASGASIDSQDTLAFSALSGVRPTIETMPLERAADAYDKMMRNEARFRMVLTNGA